MVRGRRGDAVGEQGGELLQRLEAGAQVREFVEAPADVHGDRDGVVLALGVGETAQQPHERRAGAGKLVRGIADGGIVHAKADDLVGELVAVLLHAVDEGDELLVLHVGAVHRVGVPLCEVQRAVVDVPPAEPVLTGCVGFQGDDWQR